MLMHDEEDEEVQSFLMPRSLSVQSEESDHKICHEDKSSVDLITNNGKNSVTLRKSVSSKPADTNSTAQIINSTTDSMHSIELTDSTPSTPSRRMSHRRSGALSHSRSESLPVAPKVPHVEPIRHDRMRHFAQSPLYKFAKIRIKQDPFLSPLHAANEVLCNMPATYLVVRWFH